MQTPLMVKAHGLTKFFGPVQALAGLDVRVAAGTTTCLLGPNGAGKTTAVRVLCTLLRPNAGWARVAGHDVRTRAPRCAGVSASPGSTPPSTSA